MAENIASILKYNRNLLSLNLSGMAIAKERLAIIIAGIRRSMSLVSLNLSGNPFVWECKQEDL